MATYQHSITSGMSTDDMVCHLQDSATCDFKMTWQDGMTMLVRTATSLGLCGAVHLALTHI